MDADRRGLTPHRREHWGVEAAEELEAAVEVVQTPEETRVEAKRLLWRDSAIILVGIVMALLVAQLLPRSDPGLAADATDLASGAVTEGSHPPAASGEPGPTFGPIVDPSLGIDATRPPRPGVTLPPTGTFEPGETRAPTPRPTKPPPATIAPPTPAPTPTPTPEITPEITPVPDPPAAGFSWSATLLVVQFTDASTGDIETWAWDFGDGTGSAEASPSHAYLDAGDYIVRLTVTGPGGSDVVEQQVTVSSV
jgi:hypothetical protein